MFERIDLFCFYVLFCCFFLFCFVYDLEMAVC
jgi:hypothetical protein